MTPSAAARGALLVASAAALGTGALAAESGERGDERARTGAEIAAGALLADAAGRPSLGAAAGDSELEVGGQLQFRYMLNKRDNPDDDEREVTHGFVVRRAKLDFEGEIELANDREMDYGLTLAFDRDGGEARLDDAYAQFELGDNFDIRFGRFRPSVLREETVSSKRQLAIERSLVRAGFGQERVQGVALFGESDRVRGMAAVMDGGTFGEDELWVQAARGEFLVRGDWRRFRDFTSWPEEDEGLAVMVGGGILRQDLDEGDEDEDDSTTWRWTADVSVEISGFTFMAAVVGNHVDQAEGPQLDQYGAVVQGGMHFTNGWEPFARYEWGDADEAGSHLSLLTVGVNRYIIEHTLKWSADLGYSFGQVSDFWKTSGAGWLEDQPGERGQVLFRTQLQVLF